MSCSFLYRRFGSLDTALKTILEQIPLRKEGQTSVKVIVSPFLQVYIENGLLLALSDMSISTGVCRHESRWGRASLGAKVKNRGPAIRL